ncbi:acyltransferase [Actinocorallia sp. B10E7]|uniref:acyltransferase family protein n=1 Tax=Actinocorallia sp. B10E7 TaxID=3153558 RepID=UPI00325C840C
MVSALAARIEAATPAGRDREIDGLRAIAIAGVVLGHWLVTGFTAADGALTVTSPLREMPWLAPVSWALQTLAPFFLVGGYTAALGLERAGTYRAWLGRRLARLARPVPVLLGFWALLAPALWLAGLTPSSVEAIVRLVLSPLWFLCVFAVLTALTPLFRRLPPWGAVIPLCAVAAVDVCRFALDGPAWLGLLNVLTGWSVPFALGAAWARHGASSRRTATWMLGAGAAATAALVAFAGYPASMVGVPGAGLSNLNPPTLAAVAFGVAQTGLALLLKDRVAVLLRAPLAWAPVVLVNLSAMTVFLWHQSALLLTTAAFLGAGPLPGLHTAPDDPAWIPARLCWLPVFALALAALWALFARFESARPERP